MKTIAVSVNLELTDFQLIVFGYNSMKLAEAEPKGPMVNELLLSAAKKMGTKQTLTAAEIGARDGFMEAMTEGVITYLHLCTGPKPITEH